LNNGRIATVGFVISVVVVIVVVVVFVAVFHILPAQVKISASINVTVSPAINCTKSEYLLFCRYIFYLTHCTDVFKFKAQIKPKPIIGG
jgi:hypothetical protein